MTDAILDLRSHEYQTSTLVLNNATVSGTAHGFTLGAQRLSHRGNVSVCVRITDPQGRVLNLTGFASHTDTNARGPAGHILSTKVTAILTENGYSTPSTPATDGQRAIAADRLRDVMDVGLACIDDDIDGPEARFCIQAAAEGISTTTATEYLVAFGHTTSQYRVTPRDIARLAEAGFTPAQAREWFGNTNEPRIPTATGLTYLAKFRDLGWSGEQTRELHGPNPLQGLAAWAKVGPERASQARRAGLTVAETNRLIRTGTWDPATINFMAALND